MVTADGARAAAGARRIASLATYVPPRVLTNADLEKMVETSDEWILQRTGIRERHIVDRRRDVGSREGGGAQGDRARRPDARRHRRHRRRHGDARHDVSEHRVPLQHKIGAPHAWGFDLSAACPAFTYSLTTASQLVASGAHEHALVVGADVMSSIIDYTDRATCVLFGDGAGAVVVSRGRDGRRRDPRFRARDRRQRRAGAVHAGGRQPAAAVARDGRSAAALREAGRRRRCSSSPCARRRRSRAALLERNGLTPARHRSVRVAPGEPPHHPVGDREARRAIRARSIINIERFGNTTAATIPLALNDAVRSGPAEEGRSRAAGVGRRRIHRRRRPAALGVLKVRPCLAA